MQKKIEAGLVSGVLNMETGRIRKYRSKASKQQAYREGKKKMTHTHISQALGKVNNLTKKKEKQSAEQIKNLRTRKITEN